MTSRLLTFTSLLFVGLCAASAGEKPLYQAKPGPDSILANWEKIGGYGGPMVKFDNPAEASNSLPAIILDCHRWSNPGLEDTVVDTVVLGDTGVTYNQAQNYVLNFHLARYDTAPNQEGKPSPFFSAVAYQVWVGHPEKGGVLLASGTAAAVEEVTATDNQRISLNVPGGKTAKGTIFIRFMTRWSPPSSDFDFFIYQQGEISALKLELAR